MMRNCPVASVTATRTFSMSAGLDASTVTPGRTAPDVSRTVPVMVACANANAGAQANANWINRIRTNPRIIASVSRYWLPTTGYQLDGAFYVDVSPAESVFTPHTC